MMVAKSSSVTGLLHPQVGKPQRVPFGSLKLSPERFQVRRSGAMSYVTGLLKDRESKVLVTTLFHTLEAGEALDPPIFWQDSGGMRWIIDGHHRMEALTEAGTVATAKVSAQRFTGTTEAEARAFALEVNRKDHLNLHPDEAINSYWRRLLCGEVSGSVRGRAKTYRVSVSTVTRMDRGKPVVLAQLAADAKDAGVELDSLFILTNAPDWKELSKWREAGEQTPTDGRDRAAVERLLKSFTIRFADTARARPDELLQAFEEFFTEATGQAIVIRREVRDDDDADF